MIYSSSFCKALSPALRIGYVAAEPAHVKILMREKIHSVFQRPRLGEFLAQRLQGARVVSLAERRAAKRP